MLEKIELLTVASFARLHIDDKEVDGYIKDLNKILSQANILQELSTTDVVPTTHIVTKTANAWRSDISKPCSYDVIELILNNAPAKKERFYKIKKVLK
ncbi:MAG: Asp-tRNA(Asn)/Glu-tRNA(Gln) amidotransferase subunit GatC [Endomicrobium sp.]|jgi:aspartyl/glutamyl-tRNA(Asn/Gln) amidotransferase C subunit|nr:Asp-tRNA(Asn)/Glu-tRNA(Gln) amidotransferase subunit GatC [Endomicrobium sp.]